MKKIPTPSEPLHPIQIIWKFTDCPRKDGQVLCYLLRKDDEIGEEIVMWTLLCEAARDLVKWYFQKKWTTLVFECRDGALRLVVSMQDTPIGKQFDLCIGDWIHRLPFVEMDELIHYIQKRLLDK